MAEKKLVLNSKLCFTDGEITITLPEAIGILQDYIDGELIYKKYFYKEFIDVKP